MSPSTRVPPNSVGYYPGAAQLLPRDGEQPVFPIRTGRKIMVRWKA